MNLSIIIPCYYYQIASADEMGHTTISDEKRFQTQSGSPLTQARNMLRPIYHPLQCGLRANQTVLVALGTFGIFMVGLIGWRVWSEQKRSHRGAFNEQTDERSMN